MYDSIDMKCLQMVFLKYFFEFAFPSLCPLSLCL